MDLGREDRDDQMSLLGVPPIDVPQWISVARTETTCWCWTSSVSFIHAAMDLGREDRDDDGQSVTAAVCLRAAMDLGREDRDDP